jgi:hypothetical protein
MALMSALRPDRALPPAAAAAALQTPQNGTSHYGCNITDFLFWASLRNSDFRNIFVMISIFLFQYFAVANQRQISSTATSRHAPYLPHATLGGGRGNPHTCNKMALSLSKMFSAHKNVFYFCFMDVRPGPSP